MFFANYEYHTQFESLNLILTKNPATQDLVPITFGDSKIHEDKLEAQEQEKKNCKKISKAKSKYLSWG